MLFIFIRTKSNERASLPVGGTVGQEIQSTVQAGKEVTVHEKPISAHGFTGYGYTITDPETGAGAYLIEGKGNGAWLAGFAQGVSFAATVAILGIVAGASIGTLGVAGGIMASMILAAIFFAIHLIVLEIAVRGMSGDELSCYNGGFGAGGGIMAAAAAIFATLLPIAAGSIAAGPSAIMSAIYGIPGIFAGMEIPSTHRSGCF